MYAESLFVCIATPLCVALLFIKGSSKRFCLFLLGGMGVCLLAAYVNSFLVALFGMTVEHAAIYLTPVTEECLKLLPLLFYLLVFEPEDQSLVGGAITLGVGFATFENCYYLLSHGTENFTYILIRGLSAGVMHTVCAIASGYGLTLARRCRSMVIIGILSVVSVAATYHGVYNLLVSVPGLSRVIGYVLPLFTTLVAYAFYRKDHMSAS